MKYLDESDIERINQFLNFQTSDCQIQGSCDLFATKPVGADRKLYKTVDKQFDALLESNLKEEGENDNHEIIPEFLATKRRFSTSDYPRPQFNNSNNSENSISSSPKSLESTPFGPLNETTSRRTFAYLIGILNATYPDNDFSSLQPTNFLKISFQILKSKFENTLISLGKHFDELQFIWDLLDEQLELKNSVCYELLINDDSFFEDFDENNSSSLWQYKWFIFNKKKKRVAFLYLNGSRLQSPKLYPFQPIQQNGTDKRRRLTIDNDLDEEEYDLTYNSDDEKKFRNVFDDDEDNQDEDEDGYPKVIDEEDATIVGQLELKA